MISKNKLSLSFLFKFSVVLWAVTICIAVALVALFMAFPYEPGKEYLASSTVLTLVQDLMIVDVVLGVFAFLCALSLNVTLFIRRRTPKIRRYLIVAVAVVIIALTGLITWSYPLISQVISTSSVDTESASAGSIKKPRATPKKLTQDEVKAEIFTLVNDQREKAGIQPVSINVYLNKSAQLKAEDMDEHRYWSHNSPKGTEPWYFFNKVGYKFVYAGENLSKGYLQPKEIVDAWMGSELHRKNILDPNFTEMGIAFAEDYEYLVVQHFGSAGNSAQTNVTPTAKDVIKHDGSRTGPVVDYFSICNGATIKIYENEKLPFIGHDGQTYYNTKDDIECYKKIMSGEMRPDYL